jgi:hypothetical protein
MKILDAFSQARTGDAGGEPALTGSGVADERRRISSKFGGPLASTRGGSVRDSQFRATMPRQVIFGESRYA